MSKPPTVGPPPGDDPVGIGDPLYQVQVPPLCDPESPAPYRFEDVSMRVYALEADVAALQKVCDDCLNSVAAFAGLKDHWTPALGLVYLVVADYGKMFSTDPAFRDLGYSTQREMIFEFPVAQTDANGEVLAVQLFAPFCFVDDDWSIITGREVVGYPKVLGEFDLPDDHHKSGPITVKASALDKFSRDTEQQVLPIVTIPDDGDNPPVELEASRSLWPFGPVDKLADLPGVQPMVIEKMHAAAGEVQPTVTLKQFREATSTVAACYQALVTFDVEVHEYGSSGPLPDTPIDIARYDSLQVRNILGLGSGPLTPILPFWYKADFNLDNTVNLVSRCGGMASKTTPPPPPHNCADVIRTATDLWMNDARAETDQLLTATRELAAGRYTPADAARDVQATWQRSSTLWMELCKLSLESWGSCGGDLIGLGALRGLTGEAYGRRS